MALLASIAGIFIAHPWIAFLVGGVFAAIAWLLARGSKAVIGASILWVLYGAWESLVQWRTPDANIRVDLLIIWPILLLASLIAIIRILRGGKSR